MVLLDTSTRLFILNKFEEDKMVVHSTECTLYLWDDIGILTSDTFLLVRFNILRIELTLMCFNFLFLALFLIIIHIRLSEKNTHNCFTVMSRVSASQYELWKNLIVHACAPESLNNFLSVSTSLFCTCNHLWLHEKSSCLGCCASNLHSVLQLGVFQQRV